MPLAVHFEENVERYFLNQDDLTAADRLRVLGGVEAELGRDADRFLRENPLAPPHPGHPDRFWYDFVMMTAAGDLCSFWFACDGRGHTYGVTEVLYVHRTVTPI